MTNPNSTLIAALLDRSGSMNSSVQATEHGWRELIDVQRANPGICHVSLAQFDYEYDVVYPPTDIAAPHFEGRLKWKLVNLLSEKRLSALPLTHRVMHAYSALKLCMLLSSMNLMPCVVIVQSRLALLLSPSPKLKVPKCGR